VRRLGAAALLVALSAAVASSASAIPVGSHPLAMPVPFGRSVTTYGALACRAVGACEAAGLSLTSDERTHSVVDAQVAGAWKRAQVLALPDGVSSTASSQLNGLACPRLGSCLAVGYVTTSPQPIQPMLATQVHGTWGTPTVDVPVPAGTVNAELHALWCGHGTCLAAGIYETNAKGWHPFVDAQQSGTWSPSVVLPTPSGGSLYLLITAVSCTTIASCTIVGTAMGGSTTTGFSLLERYGHWASVAVPMPAGTSRSALLAMSCGGGTCVAVGAAGPTTPYLQDAPFSVQLQGGRWKVPRLLAWHFASPITSGGRLSGVSCTSALRCVATGLLVGPSVPDGGEVPVAYTLAGGHWSPPAIAPVPGFHGRTTTGASLSAIACPTPSPCETVGWATTGAGTGNHPFSNLVVPSGTGARPSAPRSLALSAAHGVVTLSWAAPSELGGSPITSYLVVARADHEIPVTCIAITQSCALHGIVHGHTYKVDVTATNAADRSGPTARRTVPL
jgi:hypothetical protein